MLTRINTAVFAGVEGHPVVVETDLLKGIPRFNIVGLPSATVLESRERIKSAINNSGFEFPRGKITVNLTPAGLRKNGSHLDLPIAIGLLCTNMYVDAAKTESYGIIGELALDGKVLGVNGVLPMVLGMARNGVNRIIVPDANYKEASLAQNIKIIPCRSLTECAALINEKRTPRELECESAEEDSYEGIDFSQIKGQEMAKRAIAVAVTGGHGLIMVGSPGCGKTMLARRIPTIMPPMNRDEILETSIIYSVAGKLNITESMISRRPFRSPHSSIGVAGLIGGGNNPHPGELSLAHNGILFLDEVCEFSSRAIESLRLPLEDKEISHFRQGTVYRYPCNFGVVMAANPCKCGYAGSEKKPCKCSERELEQYRRKLSGPIMDRIDIRLEMSEVEYDEMTGSSNEGLSSAKMYEMVQRGRAFARSEGRNNLNAMLDDGEVEELCRLGQEELILMRGAYENLGMSPRAYTKVLKVARTIADIDESSEITAAHLAEAISYRIYSGPQGE